VKTLFLINPNAGTPEGAEAVRDWAANRPEYACWTSSGPEYTRGHVEQSEADGFTRIVAVGGDGTLSQIVDAVIRTAADLIVGLVPLGTGNDWARTAAIPSEVEDALACIEQGRMRSVDAIHVEWDGGDRYGVNVAAGGFSGAVDEKLTQEMKASWGPMAYLLGAARVLPDLKEYETQIALDDEVPRSVRALNIVAANGRTAAGGKRVAPRANPCDGQLDVVVVERGELSELAQVGARLMAGNYLESPLVQHWRAQRLRVTSDPGMWFNVDGELLTNEPVTISVVPEALRMIVGTDFRPVPEK
jgi:diacylglycerol kinase (ATP)